MGFLRSTETKTGHETFGGTYDALIFLVIELWNIRWTGRFQKS